MKHGNKKGRPSHIEGLTYELRAILKDTWTLSMERDVYKVTFPKDEDWEPEMWRMIRFLRYDTYMELTKHTGKDCVGYDFYSSTGGLAFLVEFRSA